MIKIVVGCVIGVFVCVCAITGYACCVVSGECARMEEKMEALRKK